MYDDVDEIEDMLVRSRWAKIDPNDQDAFIEAQDLCQTEIIAIDSTEYGGVSLELQIRVHIPKDLPKDNRRAILYCHHGGFIRKNAEDTQLWAKYSASNF